MPLLVERIPPADVIHLVDEPSSPLTDLRPIPRFDGTAMSREPVPEEGLSEICTIDEAEATLDAAFAEGQPSMDEMERLVCALGSSVQLHRLINDVSRDKRRLASIAGVSERHPLGFYKIPLLSKPEYQLRLNIRPGVRGGRSRFGRRTVLGEQLNGRQDVHNHEFDAAARVLIGNLLTRIYEFVDEPPLQYHTWQQVDDSDDLVEAQRSADWFARQSWRIAKGYSEEHESRPVQIFRGDKSNRNVEAMKSVEAGHTRPIYNAIIKTGGAYSFTHRTFHRDWPLSSADPTATLFLRGRPDFGRDTIGRFLPARDGGSAQRPKERMTSREVALGLTALKALLANT